MDKSRRLAVIAAIAFATRAAAQEASPAARADLVPTGKLRVGVNLGNSTTVDTDPATGALRGVAVDVGQALASALGVPIELLTYPSAGKMAQAAKNGEWDVAFLAVDPVRAPDVAFPQPYMEVLNTYLVPPGSSIRTLADVDRPGMRVAVQENNAPDLFLSRTLRSAELVRTEAETAAFELLRTGQANVLASGRGRLLSEAAAWPGSRVLDEHFLAVDHAIGVPRGRDGALQYVRAFVESAKRTGIVEQAIQRRGLLGLRVAPAFPTN